MFPAMSRKLMVRAIAMFGSEAKLGAAIGYTQHAVWRAKKSGRPSPEMAVAVDLATNGIISRYALRPDVFAVDVDAQRKKHATTLPRIVA